MKPLKCIAAVNQAGGIGKNGRLLYHLHEDMRRFHDLTVHQRIICGHHTLTSFPHGKPLSDRENLILSHDPSLTIEDARIMHSLQELFLYLLYQLCQTWFAAAHVFLSHCAFSFIGLLSSFRPLSASFCKGTQLFPLGEILPEKKRES